MTATPLLVQAMNAMDAALKASPRNHAELEVRASADGSILGAASWSREDGWKASAEVSVNLARRGGGYVAVRVTRSW